VASNAGPSTATDVPVNDTTVESLTGFQSATWTAAASAGSSVATPSGTGNIDNVLVTLLPGGTVTFTVTAHIRPDPSATGTASNTATVGPDTVTPPTPDDNTATDTLTLTPQYDLAITKSDDVGGKIVPGQDNTVTFTIVASNAGPSTATDVPVNDTTVESLTGFQSATWTAAASAGSSVATPSGTGNIDNVLVALLPGGTVTFTVTAHIRPDPSATGTASNTVTVGSDTVTPPTPDDNTATDTLTLTTPCPTVENIGRIGLHHQRTLLIVSFNGPVNTTLVEETGNYSVITRKGKRIPIVSAMYNSATNSVTLRPAVRLNVHHHFRLSVISACPNGEPGPTEVKRFGGLQSLIGFHNHRGVFVPVHNGRIVGF
jgi:uncharacterized repeat protein (TIGR01451 family)